MPGQWTKELQLVALDGDVDKGTVVPLDPAEPLPIGRSSKGLRLLDPLVSIQHARISFDERRGYVVTDLDSATGTWVDEQLIQNDSRPIGIGTRLRFGDTQFEVQRVRRLPFWVLGVFTVLLLIGFSTFSAVFVARLQPMKPLLKWTGPVRQSAALTSDLIDVPHEYTRERGIDLRELRIRRVTDLDYNGLDEVWFRYGTHAEYLVSFDSEGRWIDLGSLPVDCHDQAAEVGAPSDGFPVLDCAGVTYSLVDGRYRATGHTGLVAWVRPPSESPTPAAEPSPEGEAPFDVAATESLPRPLRVVMRDPSRLAGFLAERGVTEPVHYVLCEDAFPGIKAQVLTASGQLRPLSFGCVGGLYLSDPEAGRPVAAAFTAAGRDALLADVMSFYAGNPDGLFLDPDLASRLAEAGRSPGYQRGSIKLSSDATPVFFEPVAPDRPLEGFRSPIPKDPRSPASAGASTATIVTEGAAELDLPGCAKLRVRTESFSCLGLCTGGSTFLTVDEVGCGEVTPLLALPYTGGMADASAQGFDVRATVEFSDGEVLRARITWRPQQR
jgi:hypothetical protein